MSDLSDVSAVAADAAPAVDTAPSAAPVPVTVLASGAAAAAPAAPAPSAQAPAAAPGPFGVIPEKFHVKAADGTPDLSASWAKVEDHRANLERRLGAGEAPPKTADEYKINVPASLAEKVKAEDLTKDAGFKEFVDKLHAAHLSQAQMDVAVGEFLTRGEMMRGALAQQTAEATTADLRRVWATDGEFNAGVQAAYRAGQAFAGKDAEGTSEFDGILKDYGNDARIVRLLANVGKELGEDRGTPNSGQGVTEQDAEALQKSKAYWDVNDPAHAATKARVAQHYSAKYGTAPKGSGSMASMSLLG